MPSPELGKGPQRQAGDLKVLGFHRGEQGVHQSPCSNVKTCKRPCPSLSRGQLFATLWTVAPRFLCPWDSPGKNTGVGSHSLLHRISPTQGSKSGSSTVQADSLPSEPPRKPVKGRQDCGREGSPERGGSKGMTVTIRAVLEQPPSLCQEFDLCDLSFHSNPMC